MALVKSRAISLKSYRLGETSKVVVCYTRNYGKVRLVAKGARKGGGRLGAALEPMQVSGVVFYMRQGRDLLFVSQAAVERQWSELRRDVVRMAYAGAALELTDALVSEREPDLELFDLLESTLDRTAGAPQSLLDVVLWSFELSLASALGYAPELACCVACGGALNGRVSFAARRGGMVCVEMDGFDTKTGVIIIAATNRPDVLDPALLRPGRFDRQVVVDLPDVKEREAILKIHAKKIPLGKDVDINRIAKATPGMSGADLANLINEAALFAARTDSKTVDLDHLEEARDKLLMGIARKSKIISLEDKTATAYHEAGHALLHYHLENTDPLHKVTIIPRGKALGMAISLPEKESYSKDRSWLIDRIKITMGGYVAEELIYGETTTGTQNDIQQATNIARRMVTEWGMSDAFHFISFGQEEEPIFIGKEIARHKDYSEETAMRIDAEIAKILDDSLEKTRKILKDNMDQLKLIAEELIEKETLDDSDIKVLLGIGDNKTEKTE